MIPSNYSRTCPICLIIKNESTTREQLLSIRVKHLRAYLLHSKIVTMERLDTCFEKQDLINLIQMRKQGTTEDTFIFVERPAMTNVNNRPQVQETTPNTNEQV